jgi:predicted dehydrogenase
MVSRRRFLSQAAGAVTIAGAGGLTASAGLASAEPMSIALVGCGGMGRQHLKLLAPRKDLRIAYLCDPDANQLAQAMKAAESEGQKGVKAVKDMRAVFDDKSVQAVWIATPDHWHAPAAILAANAGKHVYVEKPCSHNLREGRLMVEAARRNKIVMQVGTQSRSTAHVIQAMKRLHEGAIGTVLVAKAWNSQRRGNIGRAEPSDPPKHLDYDLWLGPVPFVPYRRNMLPSIWRWWYDFGVGDIGNDGVHDIDLARWGLGVTDHPSTITALGGKYFFDDDQQWPDTQYVVYEYPGDGKVGQKRQLIFEQRTWSPYVQEGLENGNAFYGTEGMMILGKYGGYQLFGPRNKLIEHVKAPAPDLAAHHENFLACVRSGAMPNADIEINHLTTALCHLGNIATRVGRVIRFDPKTETIPGDAEAAAMLRRKYREDHWATPKGV